MTNRTELSGTAALGLFGGLLALGSAISASVGWFQHSYYKELSSAPAIQSDSDLDELKTRILACPDRKLYVKVRGWLLAEVPVRVKIRERQEEVGVLYTRIWNLKSPFGGQYKNGVEQTQKSGIGVVGHDLRLLFSAGKSAGEGLVVAEQVFSGSLNPTNLGMVNIELSEDKYPNGYADRLITSHWILPNRTRVFGAFNATVNGDGIVELWKPSHPIPSSKKYFFTSRPEQAIVDELQNNVWTCDVLAKGFAVASIGFFTGMIVAHRKSL